MNTEVIRFISIGIDDISKSFYDKITDNMFYIYEDKCLQEHLFSTDTIIEEAQKSGILITSEDLEQIDKIQREMNRKSAAYFRIVKF